MKRIFIAGIFLLATIFAWRLFVRKELAPEESVVLPQPPTATPVSDRQEEKTPTPTKDPETEPRRPIGAVPFTSQAPRGVWDDPIFQNACEEASLLIAHAWAADIPLPDTQGIESEIRAISAHAEILFGKGSLDTSVDDTATLYRKYFGTNDVKTLHKATLDDIRREIAEGNIIIAPFDGRLLKNPHYTAPGPEYHMLVIIGYDETRKEFITNDPGTRYGAGHRYDESVLFQAIADYPTGHHIKRKGEEENIIVISK